MGLQAPRAAGLQRTLCFVTVRPGVAVHCHASRRSSGSTSSGGAAARRRSAACRLPRRASAVVAAAAAEDDGAAAPGDYVECHYRCAGVRRSASSRLWKGISGRRCSPSDLAPACRLPLPSHPLQHQDPRWQGLRQQPQRGRARGEWPASRPAGSRTRLTHTGARPHLARASSNRTPPPSQLAPNSFCFLPPQAEFILGSAYLVPGFHASVGGLKVGESREMLVRAEDAYGERKMHAK